jgi:hypothetical protein
MKRTNPPQYAMCISTRLVPVLRCLRRFLVQSGVQKISLGACCCLCCSGKCAIVKRNRTDTRFRHIPNEGKERGHERTSGKESLFACSSELLSTGLDVGLRIASQWASLFARSLCAHSQLRILISHDHHQLLTCFLIENAFSPHLRVDCAGGGGHCATVHVWYRSVSSHAEGVWGATD